MRRKRKRKKKNGRGGKETTKKNKHHNRMAFSWSVPSNELSCPVCQDTYRDPVLLPCSHSFCKTCVQEWWTIKRARECPLCKQVSPRKKNPSNLVLKNLCDAFLLEMESGLICRQHSERLKFFCDDHRALACVVCRESREHRDHRFIPINEAAQDLRVNLTKKHLTPLREKVKLFKEAKENLATIYEQIQKQSQETEENIRYEIRELRYILENEENERIAALKEEELIKRRKVMGRMTDLNREINAMESTIKTLEGGLKDADASLLAKADALTREAQRPLPEVPKLPAGALIDVAKHMGNVSFSVWYKMKDRVSYTPVILDPNTAHRELHVSEGLTSASCGLELPLATIPERMEQHHCVLGSEGLIAESSTWEVEVGDNPVWGLGVITEEAQRKQDIQSGLWMLRFCHGKYTAYCPSGPVSVLPVKDRPNRIAVHMDRNKGQLFFSDPDSKTVLHSFTHKFTSKVFPYINTWNYMPLKILPLKLNVIVG